MKMRKMLIAAIVGLLLVSGGYADSYVYSFNALTNGETSTSAAIPVSGWLDRVEVSQSSTVTSTVTVATFDGTTAMEKFVYLASLTDTTKIVRPRVVGTGITGTDLAAAAASHVAGTGTNSVVSTVLVAPYERMLIGGNTKIQVVNTSCNGATGGTNDVKVVIYYERLSK
jgi:hypothetical protein